MEKMVEVFWLCGKYQKDSEERREGLCNFIDIDFYYVSSAINRI